jgi:uncharacterized protein
MLLVESKAQTLLTLLFGFGFAAQLLRASARGERASVMGVYLRRLVVLFVIGALHVTLFWWGDVTWTYAVAGFGLLLFQRTSNRARVMWATALIFVPFLVVSVPAVQIWAIEVFLARGDGGRHVRSLMEAMHGSDYGAVIRNHVVFALVWETRIWAWYYFWLLGRFLLGYVAGTARWFDGDGAAHLPVFRRMLRYGGIAAVASAAMSSIHHAGWLDGYELSLAAQLALAALEQLGLLGQAAAYVAIVVLLMQRPAWRRVLAIVAPAGRMPLTTYVLQSVICTFVFYGWGLGLSGRVGAAGCLGLAFAIFAVEVALCHVWLRWFRFGPLEWVWRSLVYLQRPAMRVRAVS